MGFDITVNRLSTKLSSYMSANGLNSSNSVLWFTGHSRGGALANLLAAKRVNAGYNVFAYTFASPGTTTSTNTLASKYCCIFNIINEDDLVPQLPMSAWGFNRYGVDKPGSVEDDYATEWDTLMENKLTYNSKQAQMNDVVAYLSTMTTDRDRCYEYPTFCNYTILGFYTLASARDAGAAIVNEYPSNLTGTYSWTTTGTSGNYGYSILQKPAFLMQLIAAVKSGEMQATDFALTMVADYLKPAKHALTVYALTGRMEHPHYPQSYYLLASQSVN